MDPTSALSDFLDTPSRQASVVEETAHRPWPLPEREWIQAQTWDDLCFLHWQVPEDVLRPHLPADLTLETFDGSAWLGITPFQVTHLRIRGLLPLPRLSTFLELNVRTYVEHGGKTGIFFFSLDAASRVGVEAARLTYRLPYFHASMTADHDGAIDYRSRRVDGRGHAARFRGRYEAVGPPSPPADGSLEHFLTERYSLFTMHENRVHWAQIHHPPWPLQEARAELDENTMPPPGIAIEGEPLCHYSRRQDVVIWGLEPHEP